MVRTIARESIASARDLLGVGWRRDEIARRQQPLMRAVFGRRTAMGVLVLCALPAFVLHNMRWTGSGFATQLFANMFYPVPQSIEEEIDAYNRVSSYAHSIYYVIFSWTLLWGAFVGRRLRSLVADDQYQSDYRVMPGHARAFFLGMVGICTLSAAIIMMAETASSGIGDVTRSISRQVTWTPGNRQPFEEIPLSNAVNNAGLSVQSQPFLLLGLVDEPIFRLMELFRGTMELLGCVVLAFVSRRISVGVALAAVWYALEDRFMEWLLDVPFDLMPHMPWPVGVFLVRPLSLLMMVALAMLAMEAGRELLGRSRPFRDWVE